MNGPAAARCHYSAAELSGASLRTRIQQFSRVLAPQAIRASTNKLQASLAAFVDFSLQLSLGDANPGLTKKLSGIDQPKYSSTSSLPAERCIVRTTCLPSRRRCWRCCQWCSPSQTSSRQDHHFRKPPTPMLPMRTQMLVLSHTRGHHPSIPRHGVRDWEIGTPRMRKLGLLSLN